jgi:hypothetical protein
MKKSLVLLSIPLATLFTACGSDSGSSPDDSASSNLSIKVVPATSLRSARASLLTAATACTPADTGSGNPVSGNCFTPTNVRGSFTGATLSRAQGGIPARILGGGTEVGFASVFKRGLFDLATTPSIASSEDNLQDATAGTTYDMLQVNSQVIETVFAAGTPSKYYHVRTFFVGQPPSTDTDLGSCTFSDGEKAIMDDGGTIYTGSNAGIVAKDILVCIKSDASTECAEADYQWVSGSALSVTRPTTPAQITTNSLYYTASTCTPGTDHPDMSWGYGQVAFDLGASYSIAAEFGSGGTKTYTYNGTSGTKIAFEVAMDLTESLFFPASSGLNSDPANWTESDVLSHIDDIQLKPIGWASSLGASASSASGAAGGLLGAGLTITVSD